MMWKNFIASIGLLAVALIAALYSSSVARSGNVLGSAVSSLIALGLATWVAVKFVPRFASVVDWEWLPFFSHYRVTREGWIYFAVVTVVAFAAINTANNLLYMVLSAVLAVLVLSGFFSALNFRFMRMMVRIPSNCFAGEPFPIVIQAQNDKRLFPTFSFHLQPNEDCAFRFSAFYFPVVRGGQNTSQNGDAILAKRGRYKLGKLKASSRYPFGFFSKDRSYAVQGECICYPAIIPQDRLSLSTLDLRGSNQRFDRGLGHDLYMIRNYIPSDSARHVHWKASAKTSMLKTREYAAEESPRVILEFDRFGHPADVEKFEELVSYTASIAYHFINDGVEVALISDEWKSGLGASPVQLETILNYLAVVQMSASAGSLRVSDSGALRLSLRR